MSGINQALLAASGSLGSFSVTRASPGGGQIGYGDASSGFGAFGSITGTSPRFTISRVSSRNAVNDFNLRLSVIGLPPQSLFTGVRVQDDAGVIQTFLSAAASFSNSSGVGNWGWGSGSALVWAMTGDPRSVEFF